MRTGRRLGRRRRTGLRPRSLGLGSLRLVFDTHFASCHQAERADILADTILVRRYFFGFEIGDQLAVRVAHDHIQQDFTGGASDDDVRRLGRLGQAIDDEQGQWQNGTANHIV